MALIEVGKRLLPNKNTYPEGVMFEYTQSGPMLIIAFRNPKSSEIEAAKLGKLEMSFYESGPVIFIMVKIKGMGGWMDAPFSIRMYDQRGVTFDWSEPIGEGQGLGVHIVLVDANTGIVKAQRLIGTSTEFGRGLRAAIMRQYENPFSADEYGTAINRAYQSLSSDEMAVRANYKFIK